jgi:succinate dehydrogenase / fumarate reductase flavoprotein subunit
MNVRDEARTHDVLIVGAGLAGMSAAIEAHDAGADVALVSKVHPIRSHSGAAQGGINAAIRPEDDWHDHRYDTVKGSGYLADQDAVTVLCEEAPDAVWWLADFGAPFTRTDKGFLAQRPFGGQRRDRTCYAADKTGHNLLHTLWEQVQKRDVPVYDEHFVTRLVPGDGGWPSVVAIDLVKGEIGAIAAPAIVLATGGASRIFGRSTNALINTGDGVALSWRAGLPVEDMEFFQTHPTGLLNGILMTEGCRGEGAYLVNAEGERFMERYAPEFMELAPRDQVARAIQTEIDEGRGFEGDYVRLDLRHLGEEKIKSRLPQVREIALYFGGVDMIEEPVPIRPTVHYTMGGIACDTDGRTEADGIFAAGECACVSVHGANRLGGNSLLETVVFGRRAGRNAAGIEGGRGAPDTSAAKEEAKRIEAILEREGEARPRAIRTEMEETLRECFGIFKEQEGMERGLETILRLRDSFDRVYPEDKGTVFNHDLVQVLQLENLLDVALMCAEASLPRTESRGGHYRTDFWKMDNENWLKHTMMRRGADGGIEIAYEPVTIEDIEPEAEVKY